MAISDSSKLIPPGEAHLWFRKRLPLKSSQARRRARRSLQSDLRETTIDKQFYSRDVTAFVGREKDNDLSDLVGCAESAERNTTIHTACQGVSKNYFCAHRIASFVALATRNLTTVFAGILIRF